LQVAAFGVDRAGELQVLGLAERTGGVRGGQVGVLHGDLVARLGQLERGLRGGRGARGAGERRLHGERVLDRRRVRRVGRGRRLSEWPRIEVRIPGSASIALVVVASRVDSIGFRSAAEAADWPTPTTSAAAAERLAAIRVLSVEGSASGTAR
jgi:hypothetical protein